MKFLKIRKLRYFLLSFILSGVVFVSYQILFVWKMTQYFRDSLADYDSVRRNGKGLPVASLNRRDFSCDKSRLLDWSEVNDDYCDCQDGTDETETSACPNGVFTCVASGIKIPSGRVGDGICDCCDGSDERRRHHSPLNLIEKMSGTELRTLCSDVCAGTD